MLSPLPVLLGVLAVVPFAAASGTVSGSGTISVLVGANDTTSYTTTTPSDAVGCINSAGKVTLGDCATFTADEYHISTGDGICSFRNSSMAPNTDDRYGKDVYAFHCWDHSTVSTDTQFYTVSGLNYSFLGQGDIDMYYDLPGLPEADGDALDIWYFVWGDEEADVPEGHERALLLWVPTS